MIRSCGASDLEQVYEVINDGASAYRGVIAADCWHEPYMSKDALAKECAAGVEFSGFYEGPQLAGVMGIQLVKDVALIRHAYTRTSQQGRGIGSKLLAYLTQRTERPFLIGTWTAASWAIRFYERHGFRLVDEKEKPALLRRYWTIADRQIDQSVVLADARFLSQAKPLDS